MKHCMVLALLSGLSVALPPTSEVTVQEKAPWNLRAISHRSRRTAPWWNVVRNLEYFYTAWSSEKTYYAYVVDSGVRVTHEEFEGRAESIWTAYKTADNKDDFEDQDGHGTHVAGTIASKTYGVAKKARVLSVKVLNSTGGGPASAILKGFNFAVNDILKKGRHHNAVINLSLEGSRALDTAIDRAYKSRNGAILTSVVTVAAAGNEGVDAKTSSPATSNHAIVVGAIEPDWSVASFSNFGKRVGILAPGVDIISLSHKSDSLTATMSGTSMAAPHVAALALNAMSVYSKPSQQVAFFLAETGTKNKVTGDLHGSANIVANNNNGKQEDS